MRSRPSARTLKIVVNRRRYAEQKSAAGNLAPASNLERRNAQYITHVMPLGRPLVARQPMQPPAGKILSLAPSSIAKRGRKEESVVVILGPKLLLPMGCVKLGKKNCVDLPSVGEQTAN